MDKLQMAHEWAMKIIEGNVRAADAIDLVERAWRYADAMQKEADSRKPKGLPKALSPEVTYLNNSLAVQKMMHDDEFQPTGYEP